VSITYIFWDSDNTLVDTRDLHWRKHKLTLERYGIALKDSDQQTIYHNNGAQNWDWLTKTYGLNVPRDTYLDEIDAWYTAHLHEAEIRSGVLSSLEYLRDKSCSQCVVSNGRRRSVIAALDAKNLSQYFTFILCKEDYDGRKPEPTPYLTAFEHARATHSSLTLDKCLAIEDDPLGVTSAKRAGMHVIHRKLYETDDAAQDADVSIYAESELLKAIKAFVP
jgi:HAD superfamily hydrolase (TIGR01509 family)